jgi:hypothetical protein
MRRRLLPGLGLVAVLTAGGCTSDERQWLKPNERYTIEDFRRDHAACTKSGKLDDDCMRSRGWVAVNPLGKAETPKDPHARDISPPAGRRY